MKILVVEDDVQLGQQILSALEQTGWVPELAQDGIDALYRATAEEWDVIVLDLGLPKLDGLTVLKGIRDEKHQHSCGDFECTRHPHSTGRRFECRSGRLPHQTL